MRDVAAFRFTRNAQNDLRAIARYGIQVFGADQVASYLTSLREACSTLAARPNPELECHGLLRRKRKVWRLRHQSHVIYYRLEKAGAVVIAILHRSQLPRRHV